MQISRRIITGKPLYLILNLEMLQAFGTINWEDLQYPYVMSVDWVRAYQYKDRQNVGCDTKNFPMHDHIRRHLPAYPDANLNFWAFALDKGAYEACWSRNSLNSDGCDAEPSLYPGSLTHPVALATWRARAVKSNWDKGSLKP